MAEKISSWNVRNAVLEQLIEPNKFPWAERKSVEEGLFKTFKGATVSEVMTAIRKALKDGYVVSRGRFLRVR